jgi:hypothetical protein
MVLGDPEPISARTFSIVGREPLSQERIRRAFDVGGANAALRGAIARGWIIRFRHAAYTTTYICCRE